jgi:Protein of unknown function (DUF3105)
MRWRRGVLVGLVLLVAGCSSTTNGNPSPGGSGSGGGSSRSGGSSGVVQHRDITDRNHVDGTVDYPDSPPMGGNHNPVWADCTGTVYPKPIANENAVHALEHGAVWVTYRPDLDRAGVAALSTLVDGVDYTMMSPYPGLDHAVSVQSWGYQLKTDNPADPKIATFVKTYKANPRTTPEYGASCVNPGFVSTG